MCVQRDVGEEIDPTGEMERVNIRLVTRQSRNCEINRARKGTRLSHAASPRRPTINRFRFDKLQ